MRIFRSIGPLFVALFVTAGSAISQTQANSLASTSWLATVDGEAKTRTIVISTANPKTDGVLELQATYGWTGGNMNPVQAQISQTASPRQLILITPADTKIVASERPDGSFQGTFTLKDGKVKGVVITKLEGDMRVAAKPAGTGVLQKPSSDVPANCAAFYGGWGGEWPVQGYAVLWVTSVDSSCKAMVTYTRTAKPPTSAKGLSEATIKGNTLHWSRPDGGATTFELSSGTIRAEYRGPSGVNNATMQRIDPESVAAAESRTLSGLKSVRPGPDVPEECSGYFGSWGGSWSQGQAGEWYLRVAEVRSSSDGCVVRYSYAPTKGTVPANETTEIRRGSITFVCNRSTGGTCVFERKGDIIAASYTNPAGGTNNATFRRVE